VRLHGSPRHGFRNCGGIVPVNGRFLPGSHLRVKIPVFSRIWISDEESSLIHDGRIIPFDFIKLDFGLFLAVVKAELSILKTRSSRTSSFMQAAKSKKVGPFSGKRAYCVRMAPEAYALLVKQTKRDGLAHVGGWIERLSLGYERDLFLQLMRELEEESNQKGVVNRLDG
jgi:hypothetical protein